MIISFELSFFHRIILYVKSSILSVYRMECWKYYIKNHTRYECLTKCNNFIDKKIYNFFYLLPHSNSFSKILPPWLSKDDKSIIMVILTKPV